MYKKNKIVAIITARGGSKGIKNKNLINLNGHPLISYTINYAKSSNLIDRTFVTTDSKNISSFSSCLGIERMVERVSFYWFSMVVYRLYCYR